MEDQELTYRVLAAGYALQHLPEASVVHNGIRDWRTGGRFIHQTYVGIAASYTKHVRRGDLVAVLLLAQQTWLATANIAQHVMRLRGPFGFGRLAGLLVGMWRSFELDVDPAHILYQKRSRRSLTRTNGLRARIAPKSTR
jgi:hypothetical protein